MKTVLILAVFSPPSGGVGVIRTLKFIKHLPSFGWKPIVVTIPEGASRRVEDQSLLDEVPEIVEIHRPYFLDYRKFIRGDIAKLLKPFLKRVTFPDRYVQWNRFAFKYIREKILPAQHIDLVYTSVGPHSTMLLAQKLKRTFNIPFVIDFRDPFSFGQYTVLDARLTFREQARRIERSVFKDAGHINNVSRIWKEKYESLYPDIVNKSSLIHNGYDETDFDNLSAKTRTNTFTIGYNGTFSRIVPLEPLLEAIITIHRQKHISIRFSIATPIKPKKLLSQLPYLFEHELIDHKGFLAHKESLENLNNSDVSALILSDVDATEGMIPAKTFEYLRIDKPILLLHRPGSFLAEIIQQTQTGITVDITDQEKIVETLLDLQQKWAAKQLLHNPDWNEIEKFERRYLTSELARIFEGLVGEEREQANGPRQVDEDQVRR